jgi:LPPG:FO 2-phospho-L-lactate transferase
MNSPATPATITVLSGGLGGARLAMATVEAGRSASTTFVTNVADDWNVGGLPVCPDTDAVLYALSHRFDADRGWGVIDDVFPGPRASEPTWFGIGERDRVTHEMRAELLASGITLAEATQQLADGAGIKARVIPVTGDPVRTRIRTATGWHAFQEWMVRDRGPEVHDIRWDGLETARPSPGVIDAIVRSDIVVIASSSPMASLAPILGVDGVRIVLERRQGPTVALSPVVVGRALATDRDRHRDAARRRLMSAAGIGHTPGAIATWLMPLVTHFAVDPSDAGCYEAVAATGALPVIAPVIGIDANERRALVELFDSLREWRRTPLRAMAHVS